MNGTEQRQRHTAVAEVRANLDDMSTVLEEIDQRSAALAGIVEQVDHRLVAIGTGAKAGSDALEDRVRALEHRYDALDRCVAQLQTCQVWRASTRWQRLRWLVTGR